MHNGEAHLTPATRRARLAHRVALHVARPLLRSRARPSAGTLSVTILMIGAYGGSGVPRATFGLAAALDDAERDVEVVNLVRRRRLPVHRFPPGVRITTLDDNQNPMRQLHRRAARFVLQRFKGRLLHPDDVLAKSTTLWTDALLLRYLRGIRSGVVIATRPSLSMLAAGSSHCPRASPPTSCATRSRRSSSFAGSIHRPSCSSLGTRTRPSRCASTPTRCAATRAPRSASGPS